MHWTHLPTNLFFFRTLNGFSQLDLSIATGGEVSQAYISRLEQGWGQPNPAFVAALAKALNIDVSMLTKPPRVVSAPKHARAVVLRGRR